MKWIVIAIVIFVVGYTIVNFVFRKKGPAYRPYQDAQDRATTARLVAAGWQKITIDSRRPAEKPDIAQPAATHRDYLGVGPDLDSKFAEKPKLLATIDKVAAPSSVIQGMNYTLYFTASLGEQLTVQVGDMALYRKANQLVLIPTIETLPGKELMSRWNDSNYWISFPTTSLPPGDYEMRIVAQGPALVWNFKIN